MEIFLRDPAGVVPKGVPPDKRVGACPSVQEKTTGIGNVGKSPCERTNAENQSLKVQENPREHSVVANQEDIPTEDRAGIYPFPRPRPVPAGVALGPKERKSTHKIHAPPIHTWEERMRNHLSLQTLFFESSKASCDRAWLQYCVRSIVSREDLTVRKEIYHKSVETTVNYALELSESFLVNLEGLDEASLQLRDQLTGMMRLTIPNFIGVIGSDSFIKAVRTYAE